ncbi:MAG: hypothetical protein QOK31_209 [Solirubrobacteraceae bacterium]|nr:hypothetical protein [Solirubrobacteraceae bacterium]
MEHTLRDIVSHVAVVVEGIGALIIALGVLGSFAAYVMSEVRMRPRSYESLRLGLGRFLALGLEFQLGADILSTAVSPSWSEIGKLGAIAGIRTLLNYFLAQDLSRAHGEAGAPGEDHPDATSGRSPMAAALRGPLGN